MRLRMSQIAWYRSLYWRIALGFVALLATLSWPTREEAKAAAARKKARLAAQPPEPKRRGPLSARPKPALATNPSKLPGEA